MSSRFTFSRITSVADSPNAGFKLFLQTNATLFSEQLGQVIDIGEDGVRA